MANRTRFFLIVLPCQFSLTGAFGHFRDGLRLSHPTHIFLSQQALRRESTLFGGPMKFFLLGAARLFLSGEFCHHASFSGFTLSFSFALTLFRDAACVFLGSDLRKPASFGRLPLLFGLSFALFGDTARIFLGSKLSEPTRFLGLPLLFGLSFALLYNPTCFVLRRNLGKSARFSSFPLLFSLSLTLLLCEAACLRGFTRFLGLGFCFRALDVL